MFDTIEDALVAKVKAEVPGLIEVDNYAGQLDEDQIKLLAARCPAVFVMFGGWAASYDAYGEKTFKPRFNLIVAAKDLRGTRTARKKAGGAYDIIQALEALLDGQTLDLEIEPIEVVSCDPIYVSGSLAVYGVTLQTEYQS
jgi:phage gp37-like protein